MSDKVFTKKMTLSICLIILCLCALSISAGAYFSDSKNSQTKTFSTATFDLTIVSKHTVSAAEETIDPTTSDSHIYSLEYNDTDSTANGYNVTVRFNDVDATAVQTASGYCKIVISDGTNTYNYYTKQIARADKNDVDIKTLRNLKIIIDRDVTVTFIPLWGTYANTNGNALEDNAEITIPAVTAP